MVRHPGTRRVSRAHRIARLLACVLAGLVLAVPVYVGLAKSGLIRSPFFPRAAGDLALVRSERAGLRVLFVGNSLTYYNSMPALVRELALADKGARPVFVVEYTAPGWILQRASRDEGLTDLLSEVPWNLVVLQEGSQILSWPSDDRHRETHPFARALDREIALVGGRTVLFMTWGYRDGDRRRLPGDTYSAMQGRLSEGYLDLASELGAEVAPVGAAWSEALRRDPAIELWKDDGVHPSRLGSYLTACVFYAVLTGRDPKPSEFSAGLEPSQARFLRDVVSDVVGVDAE